MFWIKEFQGRNFLRGGECNDLHSTHHRIVEYLFLSHMKLYGHVTLGDDYWGHFPCSRFFPILNDRFAPS